ncbi:Lsr2 family protein [Microbacterium sp. ZXX196]|uniref:histone-like nucleoid-structuring protein Lsr2 n=1 Tax=Microbacterium sp. ZXX196 TaxID=2609291 RepID=UPI0012B867C9|nr:Lsr2 family protein [Microbacterium sp. ZXX196]MTE23407.1 Lsr2 family protein [Microbacterium sp. ZXX196]
MARKIVHQLVDDIDGTVLEPGEGETILFSLDGKSYEIDVSAENAQAVRDAFEPFVSSARRISGATAAPKARGARSSGGSGRDLAAVREWARANGHTVSDRGRVPEAVLQAYDAAH